MAVRVSLEDKLSRITELAHGSSSPEAACVLLGYLADSSNIVVARAAGALGVQGGEEVIMPLAAAFTRLIRQPATADKNCHAKEAIVEALQQLGSGDPDPYLLGIRHIQMEPVWGGKADTAANLRGRCALALARMHYRDAHLQLVPLLTDPEPQPRRAAVKALAFLGDERSELLLRMKIFTGDGEPAILGDCFSGLLTIEPDRSLPFVAGFLQAADTALIEQAALALGNSHAEDAFPLLRARWEANSDLALRRTLLLALALTRREEAFDYLLAIMRDEGRTTAIMACEALAIYGSDSRRRDRVAEVVAGLHDAQLTEAFREQFGE